MGAYSVNTVVAQLGALQFAKLELPRSVRELVTLFGARLNSADYEWVQHVAPFKAAGIADAQLAAKAGWNLQELGATTLVSQRS